MPGKDGKGFAMDGRGLHIISSTCYVQYRVYYVCVAFFTQLIFIYLSSFTEHWSVVSLGRVLDIVVLQEHTPGLTQKKRLSMFF